MKIAVLGNIIDTELIWNISPLETLCTLTYSGLNGKIISCSEFTIHFFNKKKMVIRLNIDDFDNDLNMFEPKLELSNLKEGSESLKYYKEISARTIEDNKRISGHMLKLLSDLRNRVIAEWNNNMPIITMLEFKTNKKLINL
jgi:hypothetical protein